MQQPLPWLQAHEPFPDPSQAWDTKAPAPGLLAAGGMLDVKTLCAAYTQGTFPWFNDDQPILWWCPDPRMVLPTQQFKLHRSLRKTLHKFAHDPQCEIRVDSAFAQVIRACASTPRDGQPGTWIGADMIAAYIQLHHAGFAHSIETWIDGKLIGGLYCVAIGKAVFGESMFAHRTDASKIALAALVTLCKTQGVQLIDCQQNTRHLASLGAYEIPRKDFLATIALATQQESIAWKFTPALWYSLLLDTARPNTVIGKE